LEKNYPGRQSAIDHERIFSDDVVWWLVVGGVRIDGGCEDG
jgi:hypothetical protein